MSATTDLSTLLLAGTPTQKTYTVNNTDDFIGVDIEQRLFSPRGLVWSTSTAAIDPDQDQLLATSLQLPAFPNAVDVVNVRGYRGGSEHWFLDWGQVAPSYTLDAASRALYHITAGPELDTTTHQITWTQETTGVTPDFVSVWGYASDEKMSWQFRVIAPYGANVTMPTLPTDDGDYNIGAEDFYRLDTFVMGKVPGGYDVVRPHAYETASALGYFDVPSTLVVSATGSATIELWRDLVLAERTSRVHRPIVRSVRRGPHHVLSRD